MDLPVGIQFYNAPIEGLARRFAPR